MKRVSAPMLIAGILVAQNSALAAFTAGPWLQNVSKAGITIMWENNVATAGSVDYGTTTAYGSNTASTTTATAGGTYVHKAFLTGLSAGTTYHYRAKVGTNISGDFTFLTAPSDTINYNFLIGLYSDTHTPTAIGTTMMNYLLTTKKIEICFACGDLVSSAGNTYSDVEANIVQQDIATVATKVPLYAALGNHDVSANWGGGDECRKFFDQPKGVNSDAAGFKGSYMLNYGGMAAIFIDWTRYQADIGNGTTSWLETQLGSAACQNARFRFVCIHNSPYFERWHVDGEGQTQCLGNLGLKDTYANLLKKYSVDATFSGHMHGYERGQQTNAGGYNTYFCVTGGGSYLEPQAPYAGDTDYTFITQGEWQTTPANFNGGVVNEMMTINIRPRYTAHGIGFDTLKDSAIARMHGFSGSGASYGVLDSFIMVHKFILTSGVISRSTGARTAPNVQISVTKEWVHLTLPTALRGVVRFFDITGRVRQQVAVAAATREVAVSVATLPRGIYLLDMKGVGVQFTQTIVLR